MKASRKRYQLSIRGREVSLPGWGDKWSLAISKFGMSTPTPSLSSERRPPSLKSNMNSAAMSCWTKALDRDDCCSSFKSHAFSGQFLLRAFILRQMGKPHSAQHGGGFGELNVLVTNDLDGLPHGSRKSRKGPGRIATPASERAARTASLLSTTRPKCRPSSGP